MHIFFNVNQDYRVFIFFAVAAFFANFCQCGPCVLLNVVVWPHGYTFSFINQINHQSDQCKCIVVHCMFRWTSEIACNPSETRSALPMCRMLFWRCYDDKFSYAISDLGPLGSIMGWSLCWSSGFDYKIMMADNDGHNYIRWDNKSGLLSPFLPGFYSH
jgi:hypothetical protein